MIVKVASNPRGPRVYIVGKRVHHGSGGALLALAALKMRQRKVAALLAIWAITDWRDFPFTDACNH